MGRLLFRRRLKRSSTQGRYGALKTKRPKNDKRTPGFLLDQIYTRENAKGDPRKGIDTTVAEISFK